MKEEISLDDFVRELKVHTEKAIEDAMNVLPKLARTPELKNAIIYNINYWGIVCELSNKYGIKEMNTVPSDIIKVHIDEQEKKIIFRAP